MQCNSLHPAEKSRYDDFIMSSSKAHRPIYEVKAGLFKSLAHPLRIRILELLCDGEEHSVSQLQQNTHLEASHLSSHLAVLRKNQVVTSERRGSHVYYMVSTPEIADLLASARRFLTEVVHATQEDLQEVDSLPELPNH